MTAFSDAKRQRRFAFIAATLRDVGWLRRADIVRRFDVTVTTAMRDLAAFNAAYPNAMTYDFSYRSYTRGPNVLAAVAATSELPCSPSTNP